ncbi:bifunctional riboflavin kinase/FAD synthetase [filamentous cyanobacterium CCP5]|nr:bifunctional riboflavin kinase/FAD synthetase [filamentous cyanobacterium CCP5]
MWITSSPSAVKAPTRVALGNFDGVHLGHREVIRPILSPEASDSEPDALDYAVSDLTTLQWIEGYSDTPFSLLQDSAVAPLPGDRPVSTVLTFYPHPQEYFSGQSRPLLTPIAEKVILLRQLGVEQLILLPFNQALASLSPEDFINKILLQHLQAQHISVGRDFRFGHRRLGTVQDLSAIASAQGIQVTVADLKRTGDERISSSRIRAALAAGHLTDAEELLGRPYRLMGRVVEGQKLGRTLGFPTANLELPADKFLPCYGVYSVWVYGLNPEPLRPHPGVMNLGYRPTVDGQSPSIEVHLLGWRGDLYGLTLTVALDRFLRPEQRFDSLEQLKQQIQADAAAATAALSVGNHP